MIMLESLKDYVGITSEDNIMELATKIYMITDLVCNDYTKYKMWFFTKQLPETINTNERNTLFVRNPKNYDEIIAMACLKKSKEEQKICTLYVCDEYRNLGIGTALINESIKWLGTAKPLITIADYKLDMFRPIIEKYNWELTEIVTNFYNDNTQELCFNGNLTKNNCETLELQLHKKLIRTLNNIYNQSIY